MKKILLITTIVFSANVFAQNLVPNPSFEERTDCPLRDDQVHMLKNWYKAGDDGSTPDYVNRCSTTPSFSVPRNFGFQEEANGCDAYMGLVVWPQSFVLNEYIGVQLTTPLIKGQRYFVSFLTVQDYVILPGIQAGLASDNLGLKFTMESTEGKYIAWDNRTHLKIPAILTDTVNWTLVQGSFIADSSYAYLTLGNFYDNDHIDTIKMNCSICQNANSYFLIDNVCVSKDSLTCAKKTMELKCNLGTTDIDDGLIIYPNPATNVVFIKSQEVKSVKMYDVMGNLLLVKNNDSVMDEVEIDINKFESGIYTFSILNKNGVLYNHRINKN